MNALDLLDTLETADLAPDYAHTPIGRGITSPAHTMVEGIKVCIKHERGIDLPAAAALTYAVSIASPGLAIVPATIVRHCFSGHRVSLAVWHDAPMGGRRVSAARRSDIVGNATLTHLVQAVDTHSENWLLENGRAVMLDGDRNFRHVSEAGIFSHAVSEKVIPAYIKAHLVRVIDAESSLRRTASMVEAPDQWVTDVIVRAMDLLDADRFPHAYSMG